jgi:hypothetical protein
MKFTATTVEFTPINVHITLESQEDVKELVKCIGSTPTRGAWMLLHNVLLARQKAAK